MITKSFTLNHAEELLKMSMYSVSEFVKNKIKKSKIIACPGCYPTSVQLPLIPLLRKN